jgi:hypothetical protein
MTEKQKKWFEKIVEEMNVEILRLIATHQKKRPGYEGNGPESMVHILELGPGVRSVVSVDGNRVGSRLALSSRGPGTASSSTVTPSRARSKLSVREGGISRTSSCKGSNMSPILASQHDSGLGSTFSLTENHVVSASVYSQDQLISPVPSQASLPPYTSSSADYGLNDLPLKIRIRRSTFSHVLKAGNVEYVFDFESVNAGELEISSGRGDKMVDVRGLDTDKSTCVKADAGYESLTFCVHDKENHELRVTITWEDP